MSSFTVFIIVFFGTCLFVALLLFVCSEGWRKTEDIDEDAKFERQVLSYLWLRRAVLELDESDAYENQAINMLVANRKRFNKGKPHDTRRTRLDSRTHIPR